MRIEARQIEFGVFDIEMDGPLDAESSHRLMRMLEMLLDSGARGVILDLGAVREIDLGGLGRLLEAAAIGHSRGAAFRIVGPHPAVNLLVAIRILMLDIAFQTSADALRSVHAGAHTDVAAMHGKQNIGQAAA